MPTVKICMFAPAGLYIEVKGSMNFIFCFNIYYFVCVCGGGCMCVCLGTCASNAFLF